MKRGRLSGRPAGGARRACAVLLACVAPSCGGEALDLEPHALRTVALASETSAWASTPGELGAAREQHTATLLPDGSVLLAGGVVGLDTVLSSAEIYDPRTGTFELLGGKGPGCGGMLAPRVGHTATLLRNGNILIAGGNADLPDTEVFDPATHCFTAGPDLEADTRANHTATLLQSGRVLLAGGCPRMPSPGEAPWNDCKDPLGTAELLDESSSQRVGPMKKGRASHRAALLADGRVLLVGGDREASGIDIVSTTEVFSEDEDGGTFKLTAETAFARVQHSATLLRDERVLLAGGAPDGASNESTKTEIFTLDLSAPDLATFELRRLHTATLLPTGSVLLAGGVKTDDDYRPSALTEVFDPGAVDPAQRLRVGPELADARSFHTATLLADGTILVAGGRDGGEEDFAERVTAEVLDVSAHGLVTVALAPDPVTSPCAARFGDGAVLVTGLDALGVNATSHVFDAEGPVSAGVDLGRRSGHTLTTLSDGRVVLIGGSAPDAIVIEGTSSVAAGRMVAGRAGHTATRLPNGRVLVAGGTTSTSPAELFDPITLAFTPTGVMRARREHTATLLPSGKVLVTGGLLGADLDGTDDVELFDPALDAFAPLRVGTEAEPLQLARARTQHTATVLPSGLILVAGGRSSTATVRRAELLDPIAGTSVPTEGELTQGRRSHTATLLPSGRVLFAGGQSSGASGYATDVELYDPIARTFRSIGSLAEPRSGHVAVLLSTGLVLLVGGSPIDPRSYEIWGETGIQDAWRPQIHGTSDRPVAGSRIQLSGERLVTTYETSGGATGASAANHPVAIWMPFDGVPSFGGFSGWTPSSTSWDVPATAFHGPGFLFAVTSGVSSHGLAMAIDPVPNGEACTVGAACASGFCADGSDTDLEADTCCSSYCSGACMQCGDGDTCEARPAHTCTCKSNGDCVDGTICSVDGACVAPATEGCSVDGGRVGGGARWFWPALALLLAALTRRLRVDETPCPAPCNCSASARW